MLEGGVHNATPVEPALYGEDSPGKHMETRDRFHPGLSLSRFSKDRLELPDSALDLAKLQLVGLAKGAREPMGERGHSLPHAGRILGPRGMKKAHGKNLRVLRAKVRRHFARHAHSARVRDVTGWIPRLRFPVWRTRDARPTSSGTRWPISMWSCSRYSTSVRAQHASSATYEETTQLPYRPRTTP